MRAERTRFKATLLLTALLGGCAALEDPRHENASPLAIAERFVDAFYSFDPARLRSAMAGAEASMPELLYYQGWAEGGNYVVVERRPCRLEQGGEVSCAITVRDDLIQALGTGQDVTDTFRLRFDGRRLASVSTSSNDPPEFEEALAWLAAERPELMTGVCRGFFAGGPTPQACVRAVVQGFADFTARRSN